MFINCPIFPNKSNLSKKPLEFGFEVFDSLSTINSEDWNNVANYGSPFLKIPYLNVLEKERPENTKLKT